VIKQWDDWVPQDRVREFTEENRELAAQLHEQMRLLQQRAPRPGARRGGRANGSEAGSARDSEETHSAAQGGRGPRRNRDYDVETVSACIFLSFDRFRSILWPLLCHFLGMGL
jgi:mortality factor 4-like protein 1